MSSLEIAAFLMAVSTVAYLYSSVGHGGATGYLAILALLSVAPSTARPVALWMNCFVSAIAFFRFFRAGYFNNRLFLLMAMGSIPMAWCGSRLHVEGASYALLLGCTLLGAGFFLGWPSNRIPDLTKPPQHWALALASGAGLGFVSGLTGIGGGVFLTPLLVFANWAPAKTAGGISAAFILVNSIAGLLGLGGKALQWNPILTVGAAFAIAAALIGTHFGVRRWGTESFRKVLALVLWIAATKLLASARL